MEIGRWRRGQVIGQGSSAVVSLGVSESSGDVFAVKSCELARSGLLQREQSILSALDSPFVVSYLGFEVGLRYNLYMEYAPGGSLSDEIKRQGGRLGELAIRSHLRDVLGGLAYLHARGVVHCDVKSQNVLVCSGGRAKIADFGCARRADAEGERECFKGTPMFMAPEVARGEEQGAPADVWALGCMVIEMATGRPPWPLVSDAVAALHRIAFSDDVPEFPSWIADEGKDFLSRCLKRDAGERWTAEQLLRHPFVASCSANPRLNCDCDANIDWVSPKSTLDQTFWESISDDGDDEAENARERMQRLCGGGGGGGGAQNWTWDENWVTVRSHGAGECSIPPAATETATNPTTSGGREDSITATEEFVASDFGGSSIERGFVNYDCSQIGDEIEEQLIIIRFGSFHSSDSVFITRGL
ncbi:mitogen-activated protein kinase kinase kinase A-like [Canna indica]|uniref:Mitogen-activated protein kinase kinase kinase A-like n=1 Tax=Canna indica TaxID=4628 RepID=A0AAQ3KPH0_9LILI|nr:mitogen-activated protein kinase kinase kinase A-like [Canna indica]